MVQRSAEWFRRSKTPSAAKASLGWGFEYWDLDPTQYEGWSELRDRYKALGRKKTKRQLAATLSGNLLDDVLVAAGGVEHAIEGLRSAISDVRRWVDEHGLTAEDGLPVVLGHDGAAQAWYCFADLLSWARTVEERLDRAPVDRKWYRRQGLLPALKPKRLRNRVKALVDNYRRGPVAETRLFANFTLHTALVYNPRSGAVLHPSGTITLSIPDAPSRRIAHWYLFTWDDERDGLAFAEEVWQSVQEVVDGVLGAFEKAVPKRLRQ